MFFLNFALFSISFYMICICYFSLNITYFVTDVVVMVGFSVLFLMMACKIKWHQLPLKLAE